MKKNRGKKASSSRASKRARKSAGTKSRRHKTGEVLPAETTPEAGESELEMAHYVETLRANKQLAEGEAPLPPGTTHQVERDQSGNERIVRKRYSAF